MRARTPPAASVPKIVPEPRVLLAARGGSHDLELLGVGVDQRAIALPATPFAGSVAQGCRGS
jgi:hypothetical protein